LFSGGTLVTVRGTNLDSAAVPVIQIVTVVQRLTIPNSISDNSGADAQPTNNGNKIEVLTSREVIQVMKLIIEFISSPMRAFHEKRFKTGLMWSR
jgi:hypothetical protein